MFYQQNVVQNSVELNPFELSNKELSNIPTFPRTDAFKMTDELKFYEILGSLDNNLQN